MSDEIALISQRLRARLLAATSSEIDAKAADLLAQQNHDGSWPDVDYDDKSNTHWKPSRHLSHLETLARAYRLQDGTHYDNEQTNAAFRIGLQYWVDRHPTSDNWWFNVIATPRQLSNALLLMVDTLPPDLIAATAELIHESGFTRTSANLVDEASNLLSLACATNDANLLRQAIDHISNEIRVTTQEGIQADDSFHQHGPQNMVISYGSVFTHIQVGFAELFAGTAFAFPRGKNCHPIAPRARWSTVVCARPPDRLPRDGARRLSRQRGLTRLECGGLCAHCRADDERRSRAS